MTVPADPAAILAALDPEQAEAAAAPRGPVCILAGAGTGKTRTITHRIAHLVASGSVRPSQVLAVTFTSRAAGELRARLDAMGVGRASGGSVQARTFHAASLRQLGYFWPRAVGDVPWTLLDRKFGLVTRAAQAAGADTNRDSVRDLLSEIEWAKATLIAPEEYAETVTQTRRVTPTEPHTVAAVYAAYEDAKRSPDGFLLDFDDLLVYTAAALEDNPILAEEFRDRYRCFVVDEYQDVTPLQQRVLDVWLGERDDITVVGDPNQTIYTFTGATPENLLGFRRRHPDAALIRLHRDYRSTPQVVALANDVIGAARGRMAGARLELVGMRQPGPDPEFTEYPDEHAEAAGAAAAARRLVESGTPPSEIAVLYRINAQSEALENALADVGLAYQVRGGDGFYRREEVRRAVAELARLANRDDLPAEAVGPGLATLVRAALAPLGLTATEPDGTQARERWQSLTALAELAAELGAAEPELGIGGFVTELRARAQDRHPPTVQGVTLASLHAAKGLEWDAVFLIGLHEGGVPIQHALRDTAPVDAVEEERRLLYVGITRARRHLGLSWALARNPGGRAGRRRSRFLDGLVPAALAAAERERAAGGRRPRHACRVCGEPLTGELDRKLRRCADCNEGIDADLLLTLREWRTARAGELGVRAYVVFTDATLEAIAAARPTDPAGLRRLPGIGDAKLERFGAAVLGIVREASAAGGGG